MIRRLLATAIVGSCLLTAQPAAAAMHSTLPGLLAHWLEVQEDPSQWAVAWLRYEAANSALLDQAFYGLYQPAEKQALLEAFMLEQVPELPSRMHQLGQFYQGFAEDYEAVKDLLSRDFGQAPQIDVSLLAAAAPQTVTYSLVGGKPTLHFNALKLMPYEQARLRAQLARSLYPFLTSPRPEPTAGKSLAVLLQREGLAALAAERAAGEAALDVLLGVSAEETARYEAAKAGFSRELLLALDSREPKQVERFFGANPPAGWPPRPGRYVGWLVARELAKQSGAKAVAGLDEKAFREQARVVLKQLSTP